MDVGTLVVGAVALAVVVEVVRLLRARRAHRREGRCPHVAPLPGAVGIAAQPAGRRRAAEPQVVGRVLFLEVDGERGTVEVDLVEDGSGAPGHVTGVVSSHAIGRWAAEAAARWVRQGTEVHAAVGGDQVVLRTEEAVLRLDLVGDDRLAA